ncbi:MAG: DNA polymerase I [Paludibacteraceae bacterium]|nr:DNA polymerase I [Paludibacteraceae bacterium]
MNRLLLIDAYAHIYRAYYAFMQHPRMTSKGQNTSAIFGFIITLNDLMKKLQPTHIAVAFDSGKTFRHEAYPQYKAQREATPEDIRAAVPIIKDILKAMNIKVFTAQGFEADDIIGTLAIKAKQEGFEVFMATPDKDYGQLVEDNIYMYRPRHSGGYEQLDTKGICEKYSIQRTEQVIDLLALMGDSSDNVPGCPGVGEKTAVKLINEFDSVDNLLRNTDKLKGALKQKVEENKDKIEFTKFLVKIKTDVPVDFNAVDLVRKEPDIKSLTPIYEQLEFRSLIKELGKPQETQPQKSQPQILDLFSNQENNSAPYLFPTIEKAETHYITENEIQPTGKIAYILTKKVSQPQTLFDTEQTKLQITLTTDGINIYKGDVTDKILQLLSDPQTTKITPSLKDDLKTLPSLKGNVFDTSLAHYLLQPELHYDIPETPDMLFQEYPVLQKQLAENGAKMLFEEIETPLAPVLLKIEQAGVRFDRQILKQASIQFNAELGQLENEIQELAGESFNVNSPKQVGDILFGKMHLLEKAKKTKGGQYSTSEEILLPLANKYPIVKKILDQRELKKLLSTYIDALPLLINPATGKIHTTYNQTVTATGRLSSSNPNLQNLPIRGERGKIIRQAVIPDKGCKFLSADYSQIELRLMAHFSQDEHLLSAFLNNQDIHAATAAKIFGCPIEEVTKQMRRQAKTTNFGIIYGISAFGLSEQLEVPVSEARRFIDDYFNAFPQVREFIEKAKQSAREKGYAETLFGRRRYLPDIHSQNANVRGFAERNAVNAPIQGTAADIIKMAMVKIDKQLTDKGLKAQMIMQVHDELNFNVPENEVEEVRSIVVSTMQNVVRLSVPLIADCGIGNNWLEAH